MFQDFREDAHEFEYVVLVFGLLLGIIIFLRHRRMRNVPGICWIYAAYGCLVLSWFFAVVGDFSALHSHYEALNLSEHCSAALCVVVLLAWTYWSTLREEDTAGLECLLGRT